MIAIDAAHCDLLYGLVRAQKPGSVLELGFGAGASLRNILRALWENGSQQARYVVVDDWTDWQGGRPSESLLDGVEFVEQSEVDFTYSCTERFDFILSDADHQNAESWFLYTYENLLNPGGILCYHDVCNPEFPNLGMIVEECERLKLRHVVFNKSSQEYEQCERGLLVIFKPAEVAP